MPLRLTPPFPLIAIALILSGCATYPTQDEQTNADYGPELTPNQYIQKFRDAMELRLKDPSSAQYKFLSVEKAFYPGGPVARFKTTTYGRSVKFLVNAKNSYGGYTGYTGYTAFFQGDKILVLDKDAPGL